MSVCVSVPECVCVCVCVCAAVVIKEKLRYLIVIRYERAYTRVCVLLLPCTFSSIYFLNISRNYQVYPQALAPHRHDRELVSQRLYYSIL